MAEPIYQFSQGQPSEALRQFLEAWRQLPQEEQNGLLKEEARADLLHVLLTGGARADLPHVPLTGKAQDSLFTIHVGKEEKAEPAVSDRACTESIAFLASTAVSGPQEFPEIEVSEAPIASLPDFASQFRRFTPLLIPLIQGKLDSRKERKIKAEEFAQAFGELARYLRYLIDEINQDGMKSFSPP
jgi:hypothetical protein